MEPHNLDETVFFYYQKGLTIFEIARYLRKNDTIIRRAFKRMELTQEQKNGRRVKGWTEIRKEELRQIGIFTEAEIDRIVIPEKPFQLENLKYQERNDHLVSKDFRGPILFFYYDKIKTEVAKEAANVIRDLKTKQIYQPWGNYNEFPINPHSV
jgi:hypothetical protein